MPGPVAPDPRDLGGTFRQRVDVPVRVADTDTFDHVNNAVYLTYFEIGRVAYLEEVTDEGLPVPAFGARVSYILAEARVAFRSPAVYGEILTVETRVARIGRTSLTMDHRITAPARGDETGPGRLVATGETVLVRYDYAAAAATPLEARLVSAMEAFEGRPLQRQPPSPGRTAGG
ncbi:MAG: acyl-CoA thioester hydrolase [Chloroflexota bacterium]|nr:acyl-CoA thioester hydrolase [Chloroflexota bacterium]